MAMSLSRHDYTMRTMALWNAGYAMLNTARDDQSALTVEMEKVGWQRVDLPYETDFMTLWENPDAPGAPVMINPLPIATIGAGGRPASVMYTGVADWQGKSRILEDQDPEYFDALDGVLLFGHEWRNISSAEDMLRKPIED
jgi:hypothetical protein